MAGRFRELFKPPKDEESLLFSIETNSGCFEFEPFLEYRHNWVGQEYFRWRQGGLRKKFKWQFACFFNKLVEIPQI